MKADGFIIIPPVNIHPSAQINCSVIGPYVTVEEECKIYLSIIRESIVGAGAQIKDTLISQSIIGRSAHVTGTYSAINVGDGSKVGSR